MKRNYEKRRISGICIIILKGKREVDRLTDVGIQISLPLLPTFGAPPLPQPHISAFFKLVTSFTL